MEESQAEMFQLSDVDVLSVGLVQAGAVGEDFFLTKSDGGDNMADELEVIDTNDEKFWNKVGKFIDEKLGKREEADTEEVVEKETPVAESVETEAELSVTDKGDENMAEVVEKQDVEQEAETEITAEVPEVTEHTETNLAAQLADIQKSLEAKYEDKIKGLEDKVVTLEKKNADTEEAVERKELVQKARDFMALPGKYPELGERFYTLKKSVEQEDFDWWMALLKAADEQLAMAGIFNERGTTLTPANIEVEEKLLKQAEEEKIPLDEAMLKLSVEDQKSMLKVSRQEAK